VFNNAFVSIFLIVSFLKLLLSMSVFDRVVCLLLVHSEASYLLFNTCIVCTVCWQPWTHQYRYWVWQPIKISPSFQYGTTGTTKYWQILGSTQYPSTNVILTVAMHMWYFLILGDYLWWFLVERFLVTGYTRLMQLFHNLRDWCVKCKNLEA